MVNKTLLHNIPWVLWLMTICVLSLTPGDQLPQLEWELISISTLAHFSMYFGLVFLMLHAALYPKRSADEIFLNLSEKSLYCLLSLVTILIGLLIELIQERFIDQRYYDLEDVLVNTIGTIFGVFGYLLIGKKLVQTER